MYVQIIMMSMWPKSGGPYVSQLGTDFRDERTVLSTCFHNHPHSASFKQDELIQTLRVALKKSLGTLSEPIIFVLQKSALLTVQRADLL